MSENLKQRLFDYSVMPPISAWEAIAAELAEQETHRALREKMYATQIEPPGVVWDNITSLLNAEASTKSVSESSLNSRRPIELAAAPSLGKFKGIAAILTGVVLLGSVYLLLNKQQKRSEASGNNNLVSVKNLKKART